MSDIGALLMLPVFTGVNMGVNMVVSMMLKTYTGSWLRRAEPCRG